MMRRLVMAGCLVLLVVLIGCAVEVQQTQRLQFWKKAKPAPAGELYVTNYYHETIITNIQRRVRDSEGGRRAD
jgi:hypothetical protein